MANIPKIPPRNLHHGLRKVTSAHEKVREGIANHAEKEHVRREDQAQRLKVQREFEQATKDAATTL